VCSAFATLRLSEPVLVALAEAGFASAAIAAVHKSLLALAVGYAALHLKWRRDGQPGRQRVAAVAAEIRERAATAGLPALAALATEIAQPYDKSHYEAALRQLINGASSPTC